MWPISFAYWHRDCWGCLCRYCWNIEIHVYKQNEIKIVVQELTSRFKTIDRNNVYLQIFNWFLSSAKHNPWFKINLLLIFYWFMINFALDSPSIWILIISQILKMLTSSLRISLSFSSSHPLHTAVWRTATHLLHFCNPGAARLIILKNGAFTSQFQLFFFMIFLTAPSFSYSCPLGYTGVCSFRKTCPFHIHRRLYWW